LKVGKKTDQVLTFNLYPVVILKEAKNPGICRGNKEILRFAQNDIWRFSHLVNILRP